jgi:hypothetical protein
MSDAEMNKLPEGMTKSVYPGIRKTFVGLENKVTKYEWGKEIIPGVTTIATPATLPATRHLSLLRGPRKFSCSRMSPTYRIYSLRNPTWQVMYDVDPLKAAETRKKFYDMASAEKALIQGFHFPFPSAGHVEKEGEQYRLVPIPWNPII